MKATTPPSSPSLAPHFLLFLKSEPFPRSRCQCSSFLLGTLSLASPVYFHSFPYRLCQPLPSLLPQTQTLTPVLDPNLLLHTNHSHRMPSLHLQFSKSPLECTLSHLRPAPVGFPTLLSASLSSFLAAKSRLKT